MSSLQNKPKRLVLLDAHAILHRAYHALPDFASSKGEPTGALYGLSAMLLKLVDDLEPDYIAACYDMPGPTFRHEAYEAYKAKRPKAEDDLIHQMNRSRDIFRAFEIPIYEKEGFEADDILGTVVAQTKKELDKGSFEIIIASGDMDTLQLVDGKKVRVYTLKKGIRDTILYDEKAVEKRFGFSPTLLPDYKGLRGDPSDNIMGVKGIGEKTATELIQNFGTIEKMYETLKRDESALEKKGIKPRIINILKEEEEEALFSKTLATIKCDVPIGFILPNNTWKEDFNFVKAEALLREFNFRSLVSRMKVTLGISGVDENEVNSNTAHSNETKETLSEEDKEKLKIALWVVNSDMTHPEEEDILAYTEVKTLIEANGVLLKKIKEDKLEKIYNEIEIPLVPIVRAMCARGIRIDKKHLEKLSKEYHKELEVAQKRIWKEAGQEFNINSPKQLGEVLFDSLGLSTKGLKKTEGGARSTRESELLKLRGAHPIIEHIFVYRELQKLLSTYIDNIPHMVDDDGRLRATFLQTGTTTGRMSSQDPNLQNIPIKDERGREIRKAFSAEKGSVFAAFDYSQIELRMFAALSDDKDLIAIFEKGLDIHTAVASEIFGVPMEKVDVEMRRKAKTINFGIHYGMGVNSLARSLESPRAEAQKFYDNYFNEFPGIEHYIADTKKSAGKLGYTATLFGRRRYFEGLRSHIPYVRASAERMAINAPVQGSAADIIKFAMIHVNTALKAKGLNEHAHLVLQVHDELVYEIEEAHTKEAMPLIKTTMEYVLEKELKQKKKLVPLVVDARVGSNWGEMEKVN
jgi:DNA polymerase I